MKKFLLLAGVACLFAANADAAVRINQYVSGKVSYDWNRNKLKYADEDGIERQRLNEKRWGYHVAYGAQAGFVRGEMELNFEDPMKFKYSDEFEQDFSIEDKLKIYKHSLMFNAYFDFLNCSSWTPYVGAGLGPSWLKAKETVRFDGEKFKTFDKSTYTLGWQVMAGIAYKINSNWTIDAGYRYADMGRIRKHDVYDEGDWETTKIAVRDHEAMLGIRYTF